MKIVLSRKEVSEAISDYIIKKHNPVFRSLSVMYCEPKKYVDVTEVEVFITNNDFAESEVNVNAR